MLIPFEMYFLLYLVRLKSLCWNVRNKGDKNPMNKFVVQEKVTTAKEKGFCSRLLCQLCYYSYIALLSSLFLFSISMNPENSKSNFNVLSNVFKVW